ncbi:hypothetical protein BT63DRAFT_441619 [Microthyrium microscopicum]|uniref:Uncharacterized protein n=1 Tax=Microthyrium microscopicum TaxID=703497 RepID=A0A6A6U827_9PEZI|nr:hypothetical protein BT63DRAFT_441619 [Microthyrium microscopicum]
MALPTRPFRHIAPPPGYDGSLIDNQVPSFLPPPQGFQFHNVQQSEHGSPPRTTSLPAAITGVPPGAVARQPIQPLVPPPHLATTGLPFDQATNANKSLKDPTWIDQNFGHDNIEHNVQAQFGAAGRKESSNRATDEAIRAVESNRLAARNDEEELRTLKAQLGSLRNTFIPRDLTTSSRDSPRAHGQNQYSSTFHPSSEAVTLGRRQTPAQPEIHRTAGGNLAGTEKPAASSLSRSKSAKSLRTPGIQGNIVETGGATSPMSMPPPARRGGATSPSSAPAPQPFTGQYPSGVQEILDFYTAEMVRLRRTGNVPCADRVISKRSASWSDNGLADNDAMTNEVRCNDCTKYDIVCARRFNGQWYVRHVGNPGVGSDRDEYYGDIDKARKRMDK